MLWRFYSIPHLKFFQVKRIQKSNVLEDYKRSGNKLQGGVTYRANSYRFGKFFLPQRRRKGRKVFFSEFFVHSLYALWLIGSGLAGLGITGRELEPGRKKFVSFVV